MERTVFGAMPDGQTVEKITLESGQLRCAIITYGAAIVSLEAPDKNERPTDIVLGFDTLDGYLRHDMFMGAVAGRFANRIGGSRFSLGGREYPLFANNGVNHLHGGKTGFDKKLWQVSEIPDGARFTLTSPDMDEGYPGTLKVEVDYTLSGSTLTIDYRAVSDCDTVCNLTNHAYFNLSGHNDGEICDHELKLFASAYTPVADGGCIPTGEIAAVDGTPMDFRVPTAIGARIDENFDQLRFGGGYDHNWVVDGAPGVLRPAASVISPKTGIRLEVKTTAPGVQFYAGNAMNGVPAGKGGAIYKRRSGFCLETQLFPDTPNHENFPSCLLKAGEEWKSSTKFTINPRP